MMVSHRQGVRVGVQMNDECHHADGSKKDRGPQPYCVEGLDGLCVPGQGLWDVPGLVQFGRLALVVGG